MSPSVTVRLLATQSDARLVELARQGHERAFEALVERYRRPLLAYCRRALLPDARAEDALQQALLHAWLALERGDEVRDARAWLYRIVHNTALNALRSSRYDFAELSEALSGADAPHEDLDRRIAVREALAGLAALPEQQREALLRTAVEGVSHAAAAAEMGVSEGALRGLVYRARASLRTAVTAITPMPLAGWVAGAVGHGGGAVAELAVGGGSAGLAALLAKGGAVVVSAGVLAAGVGTVEQQRHAAPRPTHVARHADAAQARETLVAAAAPVVPASVPASDSAGATAAPREARGHRGRHRHARHVVVAPAGSRREPGPQPVPPPHDGAGDDYGRLWHGNDGRHDAGRHDREHRRDERHAGERHGGGIAGGDARSGDDGRHEGARSGFRSGSGFGGDADRDRFERRGGGDGDRRGDFGDRGGEEGGRSAGGSDDGDGAWGSDDRSRDGAED